VGRSMGGPWAEVGWFELSPGQGVNNIHIFAIEKKAQRKTQMFNLKYNIKSILFDLTFSLVPVPLFLLASVALRYLL
jgi:hypothetical protein